MTEYTKVSVSLPSDLLLLAKHSRLQAPDEPLSSFLARVLAEALDRRDALADAESSEESAVSDALSRAGLAAAYEDADQAIPPTPRATRRRGRPAARSHAAG
jgi:hypothetical protein